MVFAAGISAFFGALSVVVIYLICKNNNLSIKKQALITTGYGLGTMILSHATIYSKHCVSASLLILAYYLIYKKRGWKRMLIAGFLTGFAVTTEYTAAILAICLMIYSFSRNRKLT